ncbi:MAG: hypothetical protein L7T24_03210 [Luminiphilus sp.]|nr:hypothetical protein [Luminiphilus sp.]
MSESFAGLSEMSGALQLVLVLVLLIAVVLFYSASKKFMRYFRGQSANASKLDPEE